MIQIYRPENTNFEMNGDNTLTPLLAEVSAALNDLWCATLKHPIDQEGRWKLITEDAVVKMPSFNGEQLFRVRNVYKSDSSVECSMEPIFYDSIDDCFMEDIRPTGLKGQLALNAMLDPNEKYKATSDVKKISTAYYQDLNFMEALNGDIDQSFINRWGGEILYDNFTVIVNERVGSDKGVELRYGKNIKKNGLSEEIDTRSVVTRIKPKAYNGYTMSGSFVDSPYIDKYPTIRTRTMKFDDVKMVDDAMDGDEENGVIICNTQKELDAALRLKCEEQYELGIDKPKVTINADMVLLQNTEEYKEFSGLEHVSLGDTIHCIHDVLGIVSDARIVLLKYDSIKEKVTSVTIGDFKHDYFDQLSSSTGRIESEVQNLVEQIENPNSEFQKSMQKLIDDMAASISGNDGGNMVITQNSDGKSNGIMIMDTDSKETAKKILYFNLNGISYSNNGVNGPYNSVWSFEKGGFIADWIVTGNLLANIIKGGTLTLGGSGNGNGVLRIIDSGGNEIGTWDAKGFKAEIGSIGRWKFANKYFTGYKNDGSTGFTFSYNEDRDEFYFICDGKIEAGRILETQDINVYGDLKVYGAKNRVVKIGKSEAVCMNAYETAEAFFGDVGHGIIGSDGKCTIEIDGTFSKTVDTSNYIVFLQADGKGEIYIDEKTDSCFTVSGTPGLMFSYELKGKQKGYEKVRLEAAM